MWLATLTRPAKAVAQNEYLDFLREIVPTAVPLSVAMKQREERMNVDAHRDDAVGPEPEEAYEEDAGMDESMAEEPPVDTSASDWPTMEETDEGLIEEAEALTDGQGTEAPVAEP